MSKEVQLELFDNHGHMDDARGVGHMDDARGDDGEDSEEEEHAEEVDFEKMRAEWVEQRIEQFGEGGEFGGNASGGAASHRLKASSTSSTYPSNTISSDVSLNHPGNKPDSPALPLHAAGQGDAPNKQTEDGPSIQKQHQAFRMPDSIFQQASGSVEKNRWSMPTGGPSDAKQVGFKQFVERHAGDRSKQLRLPDEIFRKPFSRPDKDNGRSDGQHDSSKVGRIETGDNGGRDGGVLKQQRESVVHGETTFKLPDSILEPRKPAPL